MTVEYLRKVQLSVSSGQNASGSSTVYRLDDMHLQFNVFGAAVNTLKYATITIWNLSKQKANAILKEFTGITLSAGYAGSFGTIFDGQICRVETGKENAVDSYVRIYAQDGDQAKNWTMTQQTLAAGWTDDDLYQQLMKDFKGAGLSPGYYDPGPILSAKGARGLTLNDLTANLMNALVNRRGCDWFIEDGKVNMVPKDKAIPGPQQVLSSVSGLIGVPKLTINGIVVRCLLNPNIKTGFAVKIDNSQIAQLSQQNPSFNQASNAIPELQGQPDGTGTYKAHCVTHSGDTRGQEWYTDMIGVSIDSTGPSTGQTLYDVPAEV